MKEKEEARLNQLKQIDRSFYQKQIEYIAGIDEAGRGPLAGPVVVGCVIMPKESFIEGVNDSKKLSEKKREKLYEQITNEAISWSVGIVDQKEIDKIINKLTNYELIKYVDDFLEGKNNNRYFLLPGIRCVGKSTILLQVYEYLIKEKHVNPTNILYINGDNLKRMVNSSIIDGINTYLIFFTIQQ